MSNKEDEDLVSRRVSIPRKLWEEILELSDSSGVHYQDMTTNLIELGIQVQHAQNRLRPRTVIQTGTPTVITIVDDAGTELEVRKPVVLAQVPPAGESLSFRRKNYKVLWRGWSVAGEGKAYLRIREEPA